MELCDRPAHMLQDLLARREVSAVEIMESALARQKAGDAALHCYVVTNEIQALAAAKKIDQRRMAGEQLAPLAGVPVAVADNICTDDLQTTCASRMLIGFVPPYDATVVGRMRDAGLPMMGKTNLDEFGWGCSTANSALGATRHPWNSTFSPGGAQGGAAAAVVGGGAPWAVAGDTGGSLRQPAALCGLVGLKPTYGRVSRYGLVATASSLDQVGCMTRDVRDCALMLNLLAGADPLDTTSQTGDVPDYTRCLSDSIEGLVIGLPREYLGQDVDEQIRAMVLRKARRLEENGARIEEVSLFDPEAALAAYGVIAAAELSSGLARLDGVRYGHRSPQASDSFVMFSNTRAEAFGAAVKRAIIMGTYVLSSGQYDSYYLQAAKVRTLVADSFAKAFGRCHLLLTPTTPAGAGEPAGAADLYDMHRSHVYTVGATLAGLPAITLPGGLADGLPVGLQLIAPAFQEERLLKAAFALEQIAGVAPLYPEGGAWRE